MAANQQIYPGVSAFFANRSGAHNWLDNHNRPFLSVVTTDANGARSYQDLFINKDKTIEVKVSDTHCTISFPLNTNQPLFRRLNKGAQS